MGIIERIEALISNTAHIPSKLYLGYNEALELDREFAKGGVGVCLEYKDMEIVQVCRDSFLEVGL